MLFSDPAAAEAAIRQRDPAAGPQRDRSGTAAAESPCVARFLLKSNPILFYTILYYSILFYTIL